MKVAVFSAKGVKTGDLTLPKEFGEKVNWALLAQAIRVYDNRAHVGLAKTKTRAEVNISKRKIYRQKGTGGARHGAKSAPIFVGGGVAHGPRPVKRELSLPSKMKEKALAIALSLKAKNGQVIGVSGIAKLAKTKDAQVLTNKIFKELKTTKKLTFALSEEGLRAKVALRNLKNIQILPYKDLNAYKVYFSGGLVVDKKVFEKPVTQRAQKSPQKSQKKPR